MRLKHVKKQHMISLAGFTLVETLIAITILLTVIIGPMTIAARGMQNGFYANEQTTATFLAQESLEAIRKLRDDNALEIVELRENGNQSGTTADWYSSLPIACKQENTRCDVDTLNGGFRSCAGTNCLLKKDTNRNDYVYGYGTGGNWTDTIYTRKIFIGAYDNGGWPITVAVTWNSAFINSPKVVLQSWVYDQYQQ